MKSTAPSGVDAEQLHSVKAMRDLVDSMEASVPECCSLGFQSFYGLMRTYLRIAERSVEAGVDVMADPHTDPEFVALPSDLKQLELQLKLVFGSVAKITVKPR